MEFESKVFRNTRSLRKILSEFTAGELDEILEKIQLIRDEHREAEMAREQKVTERNEKLRALQSQLKEVRITRDEILNLLESDEEPSTKKRRRMKIHYRYIDLDGKEQTWTGQGLTPRRLKALMEKMGTTKENYRID